MKKENIVKFDRYDVLYIIFDLIRLILVFFIIFSCINMFLFRNKIISGSSMYPTLQEGDRVLINVAASYLTDIERFDIVIAEGANHDDTLWIKRVIGLPGEVVSFKNDTLYINGERVEQDFLDKAYIESYMQMHNLSDFTQDYTSAQLGEDEYLLIGDNRNASLDSRNEAIGAFHREQIIAKGLLVYYPFEKVRYIENGK